MKSKSINDIITSLLYKFVKYFFTAWCAVSAVYLIISPLFEDAPFYLVGYLQRTNIFIYAASIIVVCIIFWIASEKIRIIPLGDYLLFASLIIYAAMLIAQYRNIYFCLIILIFICVLFFWMLRDNRLKLENLKVTKRQTFIAMIILGIGMAVFISLMTVSRYLAFKSPNFDFGLFCNMFYNMKKSFLPMVTSERDRWLSHFAVHISPIYYLLLPFFCIFPSPVTLQIAQAVIVASGIIPLYLIMRKLGLSNKIVICISAVYAFYPALSAGCSYDLHENAFLAPLILWLLYFIEIKNIPLMYVFAVLTCAVKEDAAVYVAFIALFMIFEKRRYINGIIMFVGSVLYFCGVLYLLASFGDGVMTFRYDNFIFTGENGLTEMLKTVFINPALIFVESFDIEKLMFFLQMLLPLAFLPFTTKKLSRYILILPMWLINLMPDYQYQYSIFFQYVFGSSVLLIYFAVLNLSEMKPEIRKYQSSLAVIAAVMIFCSTVTIKTTNIPLYLQNYKEYQKMETCLDVIPLDASVEASTMLVAHIADRREVYQLGTRNRTEYIALDLRYEEGAEYLEDCLVIGYELVSHYKDHVAVLKVPEY